VSDHPFFTSASTIKAQIAIDPPLVSNPGLAGLHPARGCTLQGNAQLAWKPMPVLAIIFVEQGQMGIAPE
jgi:hypothetical protein